MNKFIKKKKKSDLRSFLIIPDATSRDSNSVVLHRARICIFNAFSDDTDAGGPLTTSEANWLDPEILLWVTVDHWFSTGEEEDFAFQGTFGNVWRQYWWPQLRIVTGIWWVETKDAVQHPAVHRTAPTIKNYPAQNVNNAEDRGFCCGPFFLFSLFPVFPPRSIMMC